MRKFHLADYSRILLNERTKCPLISGPSTDMICPFSSHGVRSFSGHDDKPVSGLFAFLCTMRLSLLDAFQYLLYIALVRGVGRLLKAEKA